MTADQPRDWDKELADIDKLLSTQPKQTSDAVQPAATPPPRAEPERVTALPPTRQDKKERLLTWVRVGLGVVLAAAMTQWPYANACGFGLLGYVAAAGGVLVAGVWGSVAAWRRRMGLAHIGGLAVIVWGLALVAAVVLPRVGYAGTAANWLCR